jgi:hypothetical protein
MYNTGNYVGKDQVAAVNWLTKAAQQGHANAAFNLANLFLSGTGVKQDNQQAHQYMCIAADNGHTAALAYVKRFLASRGLDENGAPMSGGKKEGFVVGDESLPGSPKTDDEVVAMCVNIAKSLTKRLPTEQDIYWFVVEQYDRLIETPDEKVREILSNFPLFHIEHRGSRSETSYVGKPNPGVVFLDEKVMPPLETTFGAEAAQRMRATIYVLFCDGFKAEVTRLRIKYAVHYANNASFSRAEEWDTAIAALESRR